MALDKKLKVKLRNGLHSPVCPVCNKIYYSSDADKLEYIKTKRRTEIFIHTECMKNGVIKNDGT